MKKLFEIAAIDKFQLNQKNSALIKMQYFDAGSKRLEGLTMFLTILVPLCMCRREIFRRSSQKSPSGDPSIQLIHFCSYLCVLSLCFPNFLPSLSLLLPFLEIGQSLSIFFKLPALVIQ